MSQSNRQSVMYRVTLELYESAKKVDPASLVGLPGPQHAGGESWDFRDEPPYDSCRVVVIVTLEEFLNIRAAILDGQDLLYDDYPRRVGKFEWTRVFAGDQ